jgi:trichohyalin
MNTEITILPEEIRPLAEQVEESKKNEITASIQSVFQDQSNLLAAIEDVKITSIDQVDQIRYAKQIRLEAKRKRLEVEKVLDLKRAEVQHKMAAYKTEDALYLKTKQIVQIKYKHIEDLAEYQEKFIERYELEQAEMKYQLRTAKLESFQIDTTFINLREMSDSDFELYYNNQKAQHEAKLEAERIKKHNEELQIKLNAQQAEIDRKEREKKAEEDRIEREKKAEEDRIQAEADRIEREKEKAKFEKEREKLKAENEKIQAEKRAAQLELDKAKQREKEIQDEKEKQIKLANKEAERLAKLDDSGKLKEFLKQLEAVDYPECKTKKNKEIIQLAKERITKICEYLKTEITL